MKIKDVLQRDPGIFPLVNQGQARIVDSRNEKALEELRGELSTFVCEGQYADGVQKIIRSYLDSTGKTNQKAAWVSGFFGSGKSHLLKMLCHLWQDTAFPDGASARAIVPAMPDELRALLRELDTAGRRAGGLLASAGSLPSGTTDQVRLTILGILMRAIGLPEQYPQARFCLWLHSQGYFDKVKKSVEAAGKAFDRELNNLYVSGPIAKSLLACDKSYASSEAEARQTLRASYPPMARDITTEEFLTTVKDALRLYGRDGRTPCTLLVLDEVQQYIGDSNDRSVLVTEVAEAVSKQLDSQVMIVGAGQSALTEVTLLNKLLDRFTIRVPLSDAEVEQVTRKVLLHKKPASVGDVRKLLDANAGEISRQLQGTRIGEVVEDRGIIVEDYPLLPVRRRFWEHCFRQIDAAGTHSQLRSQLRIIYDAIKKISGQPLGAVVPGDELFEALAPEMVNTGVLLREINERIIQVGKSDGPLAQRVCGLVFLIGKLKREGGADIGVRAKKEHLADLLVEDLGADNGKLRSNVGTVLEKLAKDGVLMQVGDEYRLQTREGSEWDREFRNRQTKLNSDDGAVQFQRDQLLYSETDKIVRGIKLIQGAAKEPRQFLISRESTPPVADGATIPVWIQDGWSASEKQMVDAARAAGATSPILYVFIPRQSAEDLRRLVVEAEATQQTLDAKGNPTGDEGREARQSMDSRHAKAVGERDRLVREIVANAKAFQGGGNEVMRLTLDERIRDSAGDSLVRLFPRFKDADSGAWETVIKRARDGADQPFQSVGHGDATEKHPVCLQVIAAIGAGKVGGEIRKALRASPYGWPQDASDAALIALHRSQHITATLNGAAVPLGQLDQNKIAKAEFRVEYKTLSVQDRLLIRKLITQLVQCKSGEEGARAPEFLNALVILARAAGGNAPLPVQPVTTDIEDMQRLVGNEQLVAIKDKGLDLESRIRAWTTARDLAAKRLPSWAVVEHLARHAGDLPEVKPHLDQIEAIRTQRLLLEPTDSVAPIRIAIAGLLREAVNSAHAAHAADYELAIATLAGNDIWEKLDSTQQAGILGAVGLAAPVMPDVSSDEALGRHLDGRPLRVARAERDAISGRVQQAIERAAKLLEPTLRPVRIERATLRNEEDVSQWLIRQRAALLRALKDGPVLTQ
ncbi:MAG: BREX system P-loop protein BrxC [Betaproteobacteria bacterium]|nr:BREX system P-loop protein BrxC [Betaproteobacteria bacterium]